MFTWIKKRVSDAVVAGFGDGLERVGVKIGEPPATDENATQAENVRLLLAPLPLPKGRAAK